MLSTVSVCVLAAVALIWPKLRKWMAAFKELGELNANPDAYYAKWRRTKPYLDVDVPILPAQTYVFDLELCRKIYTNTAQKLNYEKIKRQMDVSAFGMPKALLSDKKMLKGLAQIENMFHKEMSSAAVAEILPRFNEFATEQLKIIGKSLPSHPVAFQDIIYDAMVNISTKTLWGFDFPLEGLSLELREFDSAFSAICLAGQVNPLVGFLLRRGPCKPGLDAWWRLVNRVALYRNNSAFAGAVSLVQKMDALLVDLGWNESEASVGSASMIFALTTNASDAVSLILINILQSPRLLAQIMREIDALSLTSDGQPDLSHENLLASLPHLKSAVYETLRLRTNVMSARIAKEDCAISSDEHVVHIKKDRTVLLPIRALHTDDRMWSDPFTFDGTRFLGEKEERTKDLYFFGAGVSRCSGRTFAIAEMLAITVHFLRRFDFDLSNAHIERSDIKVQGETFTINDLGTTIEGFWPGRSNVWKANNTGVMRTDGSFLLTMRQKK